jgi:hypothetical protein
MASLAVATTATTEAKITSATNLGKLESSNQLSETSAASWSVSDCVDPTTQMVYYELSDDNLVATMLEPMY